VVVIADVKEPEKYRSLASRVENIEVVDFLIVGEHRKYAIERKTVDDVINSRNDGRLWKQLETLAEMRGKGYIPFLVVVGNWGKLFKMKRIKLIDFFALQSAIAAYGVGIIHLPNDSFFSGFVKYLNEKAGRPVKRRDIYIPKPRGRTIEEERLGMLMAVNGVGSKTAEELLKRFGNVKSVVSAEVKELREILGKRAEHFLKVVG